MKKLSSISDYALVIVFTLAFAVIVLQVVSRYVFNNPIIWTDEFSTMLQMLMAFYGVAYGIRTVNHIALTGLFDRLPEKWKPILTILLNALCIWASFLFIKYSLRVVRQEWQVRFGTFPLGKGKVYLIVPISFGIGIIYYILDCVDRILLICGKEKMFNFRKEEGGRL